MAYPAGMAAHPHHQPLVLTPSLNVPPPVPPGYGLLSVELNRGPYLVPAGTAAKLKISGQQVPAALTHGPWYIPVLAGRHVVKVTDPFGIPVVTTEVVLEPGSSHHRYFHFGAWRNRARDAFGNDVTRFGMWSNYTIMLIVLGTTLLVCCGVSALLGIGVWASS